MTGSDTRRKKRKEKKDQKRRGWTPIVGRERLRRTSESTCPNVVQTRQILARLNAVIPAGTGRTRRPAIAFAPAGTRRRSWSDQRNVCQKPPRPIDTFDRNNYVLRGARAPYTHGLQLSAGLYMKRSRTFWRCDQRGRDINIRRTVRLCCRILRR